MSRQTCVTGTAITYMLLELTWLEGDFSSWSWSYRKDTLKLMSKYGMVSGLEKAWGVCTL